MSNLNPTTATEANRPADCRKKLERMSALVNRRIEIMAKYAENGEVSDKDDIRFEQDAYAMRILSDEILKADIALGITFRDESGDEVPNAIENFTGSLSNIARKVGSGISRALSTPIRNAGRAFAEGVKEGSRPSQ